MTPIIAQTQQKPMKLIIFIINKDFFVFITLMRFLFAVLKFELYEWQEETSRTS